jgi:drug/metabolite transporter (DMT)-like permease
MYHILCITFLKSAAPYFRKHVLTILNSHDLLFINTFILSILVFIYFMYKLLVEKNFHKTIENYKKLELKHYSCIFLISIFTIISTIMIYEFDKTMNTPFLNSVFIKIASIIFLFLIGIFLFEEKYKWKQIIGIIITLFGVYLISSK